MSEMIAPSGDLELMVSAAREAGDIAMRFFKSENQVWTKSGNSPVSEADFKVNDHLFAALIGARPDYGWLSEESEQDDERLGRQRVFIIDPIDGTRGFIAGDRQWSICIAVVVDGCPEAAVVHCPALERTFTATAGGGAQLNGKPILNPASGDVRTITASKRLNIEIAEKIGDRVTVAPFIPSLACRLVMVANGDLDGAFARPGAHEWDLAAADLILGEAGGQIVDMEGERLSYNRAKLGFGSLLAAGPGRYEALLALAKEGGFLH